MEQSSKPTPPRPVITGIQSVDIPRYWPHIRPVLAPAVAEFAFGEFTVDDLFVGGLAQDLQFWVVSLDHKSPTAFFVTRIVDYPRKRVCKFVIIAGERIDEWYDDAFVVLEPWAKAIGCVEAEQVGRKGWLRKLGPKGWKETMTTMVRAI